MRAIEADDLVGSVPGHDERAIVLVGDVLASVDFGVDPPAWRTLATDVDTVDPLSDSMLMLSSDDNDARRLLNLTASPPQVTVLGVPVNARNGRAFVDGSGQWTVWNSHLAQVLVGSGAQFADLDPAVDVGRDVAVFVQRDNSIRVVNFRTSEQRVVPLGGPITEFGLSDDERWAVALVAGKVRGVNTSTGERRDFGTVDQARELDFYRTNGRLGSWIAVWKAAALPGQVPTPRHVSGNPLVVACDRVQRPLSQQEWKTYVPELTYVNPCPGR